MVDHYGLRCDILLYTLSAQVTGNGDRSVQTLIPVDAYNAGIILNAYTHLLCSKLCRHI
jgi:hypothetical protein